MEELIPAFHVPFIHPEITAGSLRTVSMAPRLKPDRYTRNKEMRKEE